MPAVRTYLCNSSSRWLENRSSEPLILKGMHKAASGQPAPSTRVFTIVEIPWNHKVSGNFSAKSYVSATYRQNIHFKELSESVLTVATRAHGMSEMLQSYS